MLGKGHGQPVLVGMQAQRSVAFALERVLDAADEASGADGLAATELCDGHDLWQGGDAVDGGVAAKQQRRSADDAGCGRVGLLGQGMDRLAQLVHQFRRRGVADYRVAVLLQVFDDVPEIQFVNPGTQLVRHVSGTDGLRAVDLRAVCHLGFGHLDCLSSGAVDASRPACLRRIG